MVAGKFHRSESFPAQKLTGGRAAAAKDSFRSRCISLPARSHPLAAHLADDLCCLRSWLFSSSSSSRSAHWLSDGLSRLYLLLDGLEDALRLPQVQDPLRRSGHLSPVLADRSLDDFLRLADAHGSFSSATLALKQHLTAAQVALRCRDEPGLESCLRPLRRGGRELDELAVGVREVRRRTQPAAAADAGDEEVVTRVTGEVAAAAAAASEAVFVGVAQMITAAAAAGNVGPSRLGWVAAVLRWRPRAPSKWIKTKNAEKEGWRRTALSKMRAAEDGVPGWRAARSSCSSRWSMSESPSSTYILPASELF